MPHRTIVAIILLRPVQDCLRERCCGGDEPEERGGGSGTVRGAVDKVDIGDVEEVLDYV